MAQGEETMSIPRARRSRFSRVSAGRQAPTNNSADRPIARSHGARIQNYAPHNIVGIAPVSLLFHADAKKDGVFVTR